jgi:hypothetical protein
LHERRRQRVGLVRDQALEVLDDHRADRARRELFGRCVHRDDLALPHLVLAQRAMLGDVDLGQQAGARHAPRDEQPVAGRDPAGEVLAAEPLRFDHPGVVLERRGDQRCAPPAALLDAQHPADEDRLAFAQAADRHRLAPVAVRARDVGEQLSRRFDADLGELRRGLRPDAG